ncbi:uncharacterized protein SOCE26_048010 [Sorangium cellulosum]|uniref:Uncharacterized protein n=1 Tax=Sorangium cellulosum TaxID=56 RepID=A0A2L0EVM5_SORCE|nr:hypothetical protein [Sorangium cellulosum]AUX43353.1 uncharacterized protein SOCE26_048010 [Sorangium cellulosum]
MRSGTLYRSTRRRIGASLLLLASAGALIPFATTRGSLARDAPSRPAEPPPSHHRDMARALTMDHQLVRSDFIGVVRVVGLREEAEEETVIVDLVVEDTWFSRWEKEAALTVGVASDHWGAYRGLIAKDEKLVVLLAGGPFTTAPFTFHEKSVFAVHEDGTLTCASGNPLFAVHHGGFVCSVKEYMPTAPLTLEEMRRDTLRARKRAAVHLSSLDAQIEALSRPLQLFPVDEQQIDRSRIENEVYR